MHLPPVGKSSRLATRVVVSALLGIVSSCGGDKAAAPVADAGGGGAAGTGGAGRTGGAGGVGGTADAGGVGGTADAAGVGGTAGTGGSVAMPAATGGTAGTPAPSSDADIPPARPLQVDDAKPQRFSLQFRPSQADPAVVMRDELQTAIVDTGVKPHRGKLVVTLSGVGGAPGPVNVASFAAGLGFHAFAIAYLNGVNPSGQSDPKFFGDMRFEQFDGMDRGAALDVARPDCVEVRVAKALAYLQTMNPAGDWAYFLDPAGNVRWSDVIFIGHSHGATSAAAFAKIRRVWRAISLSGPRDTNPVVATWLSQPSLTPIDRFYGFTGTGDAQHADHIKAMDVMNYLGVLTDVAGAAPPYGGSHRLKYQGGHGDSIDCDRFKDVCTFLLGAN